MEPRTAPAASHPGARLGVGEGVSVRVAEVYEALVLRRATWRAALTGEHRWRLLAADGGPSVLLETDDDGVPSGLDETGSWSLELAPGR